jgi:1,4-dihydroxy-2-naphthoate octaprenyltransferase
MLKAWFMAMRPWSFTAAFVPVALGTALAWDQGFFQPGLFLLTALGGICIQAGTNFINTYGDYRFGVDTVASAHTCPQLVTGAMHPTAMKRAGLIAFGLAAAIGLTLAWLGGWEILAVGLLGIIGGYTYTAGPIPYKYKGAGSFAVFFLMGPLMVWPAWFIQTGQYSWLPVLVSLPVGFLVAAILNGNDVRDIAHDRAAGIITPATELGSFSGLGLQRFLYLAAFVSLFALIVGGILPQSALLPLLLLPLLRKCLLTIKEAAAGKEASLLQLESMAAGFHFQFGILLTAGVALHPWLVGKGF